MAYTDSTNYKSLLSQGTALANAFTGLCFILISYAHNFLF